MLQEFVSNICYFLENCSDNNKVRKESIELEAKIASNLQGKPITGDRLG